MRITILGGWKEVDTGDYPLRGSHGEFVSACEAIGKRLAHAQQAVLVGTDSISSADYHIVRGIVDGAGSASVPHPLVYVIQPSHGGFAFEELWQKHPSLFASYPRKLRMREAAKIVSVQEADSVLAIGGGESTYLAGLATIVARKTLVPVASFGGASRQLLDVLDKFGSVQNISEFHGLDAPWNPVLMDAALRLTGVGRLPQVLIIHGRSDDRYKLMNWLQSVLNLPKPIVMGDEFQASEALPVKFEGLASSVDAAIAVATPDDVGALQENGTPQLNPRARQNVWLEVGWFWGRLGRNRIMVLCKGNVEMPSDLAGIEVFPYLKDPLEAGEKVRAFINRIKHGAQPRS